jgi:hypothetical protein
MPGSTLTLDATVFTSAQLEARLRPPRAGGEIALAGRRRLAKTSSTPGKTRSLN